MTPAPRKGTALVSVGGGLAGIEGKVIPLLRVVAPVCWGGCRCSWTARWGGGCGECMATLTTVGGAGCGSLYRPTRLRAFATLLHRVL